MQVEAFFHCWADGEWQTPLIQFTSSSATSPGRVHAGLVGKWVTASGWLT